jgi:predicted RNA binding protein YcfA (HicA-like mRNA interferase family)
MSKRQKRRQKIAQNPVNVQFEELRKLLEDYGFELRRTRGSHHTFVGYIEDEKVSLVVPYKKPLNPVYVNKALKLIDEIEALESDSHSEDSDE